MVKEDSIDRPFDAVAETVGEQTTEALELLNNETRSLGRLDSLALLAVRRRAVW